jgi:hypothetical protein
MDSRFRGNDAFVVNGTLRRPKAEPLAAEGVTEGTKSSLALKLMISKGIKRPLEQIGCGQFVNKLIAACAA